jgi:hypothetical protein
MLQKIKNFKIMKNNEKSFRYFDDIINQKSFVQKMIKNNLISVII